MWSYYKNIKCQGCGKEYEIYVMKVPMRDKDSEICESCGTTLISWNEAKCIMLDWQIRKNKISICFKRSSNKGASFLYKIQFLLKQ